eukprot:5516661-Amphidinium_carterae.2
MLEQAAEASNCSSLRTVGVAEGGLVVDRMAQPFCSHVCCLPQHPLLRKQPHTVTHTHTQ